MDVKSLTELKEEWNDLLDKITAKFGIDPDLQGVIFLIGIQELGQGKRKFSKDEKQDLMHIATCRLLSSYGYYTLEGVDEEGWPHWKLVSKMPVLSLKEQDLLMKKAVIDYFQDIL